VGADGAASAVAAGEGVAPQPDAPAAAAEGASAASAGSAAAEQATPEGEAPGAPAKPLTAREKLAARRAALEKEKEAEAAFQQAFASSLVDKSDDALAKAFAKVDTDASGQISAAEIRAHIASVYGTGLDESIAAEMLKAADTDGDGEVSLDEFKTIMRAGPDVKP